MTKQHEVGVMSIGRNGRTGTRYTLIKENKGALCSSVPTATAIISKCNPCALAAGVALVQTEKQKRHVDFVETAECGAEQGTQKE